MKKSELINLGVLLLSAIGALLSNIVHQTEMEEMKEEIMTELREEETVEDPVEGDL